ncbi:hypothetical protein [Micavibrio aeruginosavorus]|uniref:Uncharacterized protein n=1 Tax=Micavibrio aeruginosavorus EPB TaxID=349215 RepID=M4VHB6_9BACT|nr:hypothetical protein [Micavibrio aeruginosavorus]AGH97441.1 hypothetical protein A11S_617 [Micavibrio aeruginosavorus EPB]
MARKTTRLQTIALDSMKTWIHKKILEIAEPPRAESCDDKIECIVSKALDWRRDYTTALTMALGFKTEQDYQSALDALQKRIDEEDAKGKDLLRTLFSTVNADEFNNAAQDLFQADILLGQHVFLKKIQRVFSYLNGTLTDQNELRHITPLTKNSDTANLFDILKDQGTFDEWQNLIAKLPKTRRTLYKNHWDTLNPS